MTGEAEGFGSMDLHITVLLKRLYEWKNSISHGSSVGNWPKHVKVARHT